MLHVCGNNESFQIQQELYKSIKVPSNFQIDLSYISSISFYNRHTVWTTKDGRAYCVGSNREGRISDNLPREEFSTKRLITIKDEFGHQCDFKSVVCGHNYTLYQLSSRSQLVYVHEIDPKPHFLNINGPKSISLYGGSTIAASIDTEGGIHIITPYLVKSKVKYIEPIQLPLNEKAVYVSCCFDSIFALSISGKLYESAINPYEECRMSFKEVPELRTKKILKISGTYDHCLEVDTEGHVFAKGSNIQGQLGIGSGKLGLSRFEEIESLHFRNVTSVFAGYYHSLFLTNSGEIFGCGFDYDGQLFTITEKRHIIFTPIETVIKSGATFCIAGENVSVAFIDVTVLPPHMPNLPIKNQEENYEIEIGGADLFALEKSELIRKILSLQNENEELKRALWIMQKKDKKDKFNIFNSTKFNEYKIGRKISEGAFGVVFEVKKDDKKYALKKLRDDILDTKTIRGFKSEYKKVTKLHHPNVIRSFGIFLNDDETSPSFILEFCPKVLSKMIGNPEQNKVKIVIWLYQIAEAMKYIHLNEIVHLDLKPANILLDSNDFIKVSDFGISKFMNPLE